MNKAIRESVVKLLVEYPEKQRKIALLRYELEHPRSVSPEEMIETMAFARGDGEGRPVGTISNKTLYIAMNYQSAADRASAELMDGIVRKLVPLEQEMDRLHHYVSLLEPRMAAVIRLFYFEGCSGEEVAQKTGVALRTAHKIKNQAVDRLVEMYMYTNGLK